jgi:DNA phosphorothioation-associated putative methyltransferase
MPSSPPQFKRVAFSRYIHVSQFEGLGEGEHSAVTQAINVAPEALGKFNVVKFQADGNQITLLTYEDFEAVAFPALLQYWTISLEENTYRFRSYKGSLNPPILHRKELLLASDHPQVKKFAALTKAAEDLGLFKDTRRIGFKVAWEQLVRSAGYTVNGQELLPIGNEMRGDEGLSEATQETVIARHKTAMVRYGFSAPVQCLARFGFLDGSRSVFDYGCGRGDDVRGLEDNGITVSGWDPHFLPDGSLVNADIVNLGFVINVIEVRDERDEALRRAFSLARQLLVVSAMLAGEDAVSGKPFGDGILTGRGTFQKYFTQSSLKEYLEETLGDDAIPVAPGVFFVFADKDAEQAFVYGRQQSRRNLLRNVERVRQHKVTAAQKLNELYQKHKVVVDAVWRELLLRGRDPELDELVYAPQVLEIFGTANKAIRFAKAVFCEEEVALEESRRLRLDDLLVYLSKQLFERRKQYKELERGLRRDVKAFFGDYKEALLRAKDLLLSLRDIEALYAACNKSAAEGLGWVDHEDAFFAQSGHVEQLPAILRAYINCGLILYGDISNVDLIKIHVRSNKLSLMSYDGFDSDLLPRLNRRTKINLRSLDFDEFVYGDQYPQTYLYRKSRFMNEEDSGYAEQIAFEDRLQQLHLLPLDNDYGPSIEQFDSQLKALRYCVDGPALTRLSTVPSLKDFCGRYLRFSDFIHCGETQMRLGIDNLPKQVESYNALLDLAVHVIDPVIDYFGMVKLTYGFCSHALSRAVPGRNDPKLDQHSAYETNTRGALICSRGGAAVDFIVEDEDMREVAQWVVWNCPFDRLYFYGKDRPIHVSFSTNLSSQIVDLSRLSRTGNQFPSVVSRESFLDRGC